MRELPPMTSADAERLKMQGHVVHIYPRKRLVCVDGHNRYRLVDTMPVRQPIYNVSWCGTREDQGLCASFVEQHRAEQCAAELSAQGAWYVRLWTA